MQIRKLFLIGTLVVSMVMPTQAAVYGTLKQDLYFDIEGNQIVKASGTGISILDEDENNYLIRIDESNNNLVSKKFVEIAGTITTANTNLSIIEKVEQDAKAIGNVAQGDLIMALAKEGNYYKVKVDGIVGYVYGQSIDQTKLVDMADKNSSLAKGEEVVSYAKQFLGGRYVYGGNNLATGVDCSGFAQQIMKHFGISIERSSRSQYACNGYAVRQSEIQPGDLVFYGNGSVNHVAIYAGNGQIIHASTESTGIIMSNLYYGKPIIGIKRVIE